MTPEHFDHGEGKFFFLAFAAVIAHFVKLKIVNFSKQLIISSPL